MSGFVVISRNQALHAALCTLPAQYVKEARPDFPTFSALLKLQPYPAPRGQQPQLPSLPATACPRIPTTRIGKSRLFTLSQPTIWTTSHNGQHTRHVILPSDSTSTSYAPACSLLIFVVTAVYTAGHSSWPLTGPSTVTSGAARPCTFALSLKPTPTSASPDNRE
jgi:hypothetical protein